MIKVILCNVMVEEKRYLLAKSLVFQIVLSGILMGILDRIITQVDIHGNHFILSLPGLIRMSFRNFRLSGGSTTK